MTMESLVTAALEPLAPGRVFPDVAPEGTIPPYIVYQGVGGRPINFVDGAIPDKEHSRVQVSVWAATRLEAAALGKLVENTLRATADLQTEVATGRLATVDDETQRRGTRQDFYFFT